MEKQGSGRLVLVPFPFQGHTTPMLQLGTLLHSKGFDITIAHTKFNPPNPSNHHDFDFFALSDNLSITDIFGFKFSDIEQINDSCKASLQEFLEQQEANGQLLGVIHDSLMYFAESVTSHMKIPSIVLRTTSASFLRVYRALPQLQEEGYLPFEDSKLLELVPEFYPLRFKDLPYTGFGTWAETLNLLWHTSNMKSSAVILNTTKDLEDSSLLRLQQNYKVPFFPIGPLHKVAPPSSTSFLEEDNTCISWLDKQIPNSVIYVSFGSIASMGVKELVETSWGLAKSKKPFLWMIQPGSVSGSEWIELLPEGFIEEVGDRGHIVKWAPQKEVLAHKAVGGFWSHCGWNSTLESICEGVPMICSPRSTDQKVNARYLSYVWKVGIQLENELDRNEMETAIRRVLVDDEGEEMRQRAIEMKDKINVCTSEGGTSYNSMTKLVELLLSFTTEGGPSLKSAI